MIKILMLNYEFPPLGGGAGNALYYMLRELADNKNLAIDVVTSSHIGYREEFFSDNIKIYFLDIRKKGKLHYQTPLDLMTYSVKSYILCKKLSETAKYDLCHSFFGIPCGFLSMILRIPYIVSLRGSDVPYYSQRFYWLDRLFFKNLSGLVWKRAVAVIANSQGLKELSLKSYPGQDIKVIPNGVDLKKFTPSKKSVGPLKVLCVSRLINRKGVKHIIEAAGELKDEMIEFTIVGNGDQIYNLERLALKLGVSDKVHFSGDIPHNKLIDVYKDNDVFLLPSYSEGMSNAVLEAMASGMPVIVTDTGGTSELIKGNGFIVEKRDHRSIVSSLKYFLNDSALLEQMGKKSREIAESMSWEHTASKYIELYDYSVLQ